MAPFAASIKSQWREIRDAFASLVFPAPCRICGQMLDTGQRIPFCHACIEHLSLSLSAPQCAQCGRPIVSPLVTETLSAPRCHMCRNGVYDFDLARSFGAYTPAMARAVLLLKYSEVTPLGAWFARLLERAMASNPALLEVDAVVPVPLDAGRTKERGYNQAELIARPLARMIGIPFQTYLLVRTKPRPAQLRLTRRERWETVRGAYAMHHGAEVDKMRVLLVDDVFTTGATLDACSRALRQGGAARVVGLTVARALPQWINPEAAMPYQDLGE